MKKIISLVIVSFFILNFTTQIFALPKTVDITGFDNFAISQVQNILATTLTANTQNNQNQENTSQMLLTNIDINFQNISCELDNLNVVDFNTVVSLNDLYRYKLFEKNNFVNNGLTKYEINLNSYIAVVLSFIDNFIIENIYIG